MEVWGAASSFGRRGPPEGRVPPSRAAASDGPRGPVEAPLGGRRLMGPCSTTTAISRRGTRRGRRGRRALGPRARAQANRWPASLPHITIVNYHFLHSLPTSYIPPFEDLRNAASGERLHPHRGALLPPLAGPPGPAAPARLRPRVRGRSTHHNFDIQSTSTTCTAPTGQEHRPPPTD